MRPIRQVVFSLSVLVAVLGCARVSPPPASTSALPREPVIVTITVPYAGWRIAIDRVLELDREVWILAQLTRAPGPAAQMIVSVSAEVPVALPAEKPRRVFVAGKTWAWPNEEPVEFVASLDAVVLQRAGTARVLFPVVPVSAVAKPTP